MHKICPKIGKHLKLFLATTLQKHLYIHTSTHAHPDTHAYIYTHTHTYIKDFSKQTVLTEKKAEIHRSIVVIRQKDHVPGTPVSVNPVEDDKRRHRPALSVLHHPKPPQKRDSNRPEIVSNRLFGRPRNFDVDRVCHGRRRGHFRQGIPPGWRGRGLVSITIDKGVEGRPHGVRLQTVDAWAVAVAMALHLLHACLKLFQQFLSYLLRHVLWRSMALAFSSICVAVTVAAMAEKHASHVLLSNPKSQYKI